MKSSDSIGLCDDIFGDSNHFILSGCPFVRSVGVDVQENGFGFVWLPGQLPFYVKDPSQCVLIPVKKATKSIRQKFLNMLRSLDPTSISFLDFLLFLMKVKVMLSRHLKSSLLTSSKVRGVI